MDLPAFMAAVKVVEPFVANELRSKYHATFLATETDNYRARVGALLHFSDGLTQNGYMWDCLKSFRIAEWDEIRTVIGQSETVLALWDIHSSDRIRIPNYWKFARNAVIACSPTTILDGLPFLPDDLYVFDETFDWTVIFTHEPWVEEVHYKLVAPASFRMEQQVLEGERTLDPDE